MNVISLKAARSRLRQGQPVQPPPTLTSSIPAGSRTRPGEDLEDGLRMKQNLAAFTVIVCIVVLGTWLIENLRTYSRIQMCIEAGHRNCVPVDHKYQPRRFE